MSVFEHWREEGYIIHTLYDWYNHIMNDKDYMRSCYPYEETEKVVLDFLIKLVEYFFIMETKINNEFHAPKPGDDVRFQK